MRKLNLIIVAVLITATMFVSCKKEETPTLEPKPVISNFTVGNEVGGGSTLILGGLISFEFNAEMKTGDKLKSYHLEMHDEPASGLAADEYKVIDEEFDVSGLRNTHIHDHIEIPLDANTGNYHFHLTVTSQDGYTTSKETHLSVEENTNAPVISNFSVTNKSGSTDFQVGDILIVSFEASAKNDITLKSYHLEIHDEPVSGELEDEFKLVDDEFTADFANESSVVINKEIEIKQGGTKGKYHVHLHVYDNQNNGAAKADEISIN